MAIKGRVLLLIAALLMLSLSKTDAMRMKTRKTNIQFYMHDVVEGNNPTAVRVARPQNFTRADQVGAMYGSVYVMDNPLTVNPNPNSTLVGRAQGIYVMSSQQNEFSLHMTLTIVFVTGPYNGSTLSVVGRNPITNEVREIPVVGGTGVFRLARGYCLASTHSFERMDAIIGVIRWKLRGWLSGISACKVSLDDERETQRKMRLMGFGSIEECRGNKMVNRKSWWRRKNGRQINSENETQARNDASIMGSKSSDSSSWSGFNHAQDEEYIVFCFREDGAFDVVKDGMSESLDCFGSKQVSPGVATPEFYYDEVAETVEESNHEITPNIAVTSNDQETIPVEHEETKLGIEPPYTSETVRHEVEGTVDGGMVSVESSDSNQSFASTGSFSFPVLQRDFMGSPVQMPKSESLQLRKDRISCGRFQCWRF